MRFILTKKNLKDKLFLLQRIYFFIKQIKINERKIFKKIELIFKIFYSLFSSKINILF